MRRVRSLAALAVLVGLVLPARAGDQSAHLKNGLRARAWSPWPASVHSGWAPIFVELENGSEREQRVELTATGNDWNSQRNVRAGLTLAPGTRGALELLVPLGADYANEFGLTLECGDEKQWLGGVVGSSGASLGMHQVLLVGDFASEAGTVERWAAGLSTVVVQGIGGIGYVSSPGPAPAPNDFDLAQTSFVGLARHHAAFSSLDLVVLDPSHGLPGESELAGLAAWVRTGGSLLVLGAEARRAALASATLAAWMEPRLETECAAGSEYRMGLGRLFVGAAAGDLESAAYVDWVRAIVADNAGLTPRATGWRGATHSPEIPGLVQLPFRSFAALLVLFAIVIGPVNFVLVKKKKRPVLLLLTIPAIAGVTTVALLAYGILFQGLDVKTASYSVAVLDQREHRSACVESRQLFAGMAPAAGLALGSGTIVHEMPNNMGSYGGGNRQRYEVELEGGMLLSGEYLPSRKAKTQVLATERSERARLDVHASGMEGRNGGLRVDNNLGATVQELFLCDPEGGFHRLTQALLPGASAELTRAEVGPELFAEVDALLDLAPPPAARSLAPLAGAVPPGTYLARLERSPFRDACGIETNELFGAHVLFGVLALAPEDWR